MPPVHYKFGSIEHFKNFLHEVKLFYKNIPEDQKPKEIKLRGTVKLHGTHADYVYAKNDDGTVTSWCQSRNRVLSVNSDNAGFANFMDKISTDKKMQLISAVETVYKKNGEKEGPMRTLVIAGEFCGENIQKRVALSDLPKMFVIFGIKINDTTQYFPDYYHVNSEKENINNISKATIYATSFHLDEPELVVPILKDITDAVEKECPFAKSFGVSGIGEGVVWTAENLPCSSRFCFKVKGEVHAVSRVKTLGKRTEGELELLKQAKTFAQNAVLEPRLLQGYDYLREMNLDGSTKNLGVYIKWIVQDVEKEEGDSMKELGLNPKLVRTEVSKIAKAYYTKQGSKWSEP